MTWILAGALADEIAVLYLGQIMEHLPGRDLLEHPAHPYTPGSGPGPFPTMDAVRDLGGTGDAFYRMVHAHAADNGHTHVHTHVASPGRVSPGGHAPPEGCLFQPRCTQAIPPGICGHGDHAGRGPSGASCLRGGIARGPCILNRWPNPMAKSRPHPRIWTLMAGEVFCLVGETDPQNHPGHDCGGAVFPGPGNPHLGPGHGPVDEKKEAASLATRIGIIYQNPAESVSHRPRHGV